MEHSIIREIFIEKNIILEDGLLSRFEEYAYMVMQANKRFNLTGGKNINKIVNNLIIESILPVINADVPRGTVFADIGTGAGIPGIPIGMLKPDTRGFLFDSNYKKVKFIESVIKRLNLDNLHVIHGRIEEIGRENDFRDSFDIVFSRAVGNIYISLELSAPLLSKNGILYVYSTDKVYTELNALSEHIKILGLEPVKNEVDTRYNIGNDGLIFKKIKEIDKKYPRRFSVIKRDSKKISKNKDNE